MGRVDGQVIGEREDSLGERAVHLVRQFLAVLVAEEVGPSDRAHHERSAREQRHRTYVIGQQVRQVVWGVAGGGDGPESVAADLHHVPVDEAHVVTVESGGSRSQERGAAGGEVGTARDVVGVRVRVRRIRDAQPALGGAGNLRGRDAGRVDHQGGAIAEIHQIRRVTEALVHEACDLRCHHEPPARRSNVSLSIGVRQQILK